MNITQVKGVDGRLFNVRLVRKGDKYGREDVLTHNEEDPLVEFYDASQDLKAFGPRGQFVSRYYRATLLEADVYSLNLAGDVDAWTIPARDLLPLVSELRLQAWREFDARFPMREGTPEWDRNWGELAKQVGDLRGWQYMGPGNGFKTHAFRLRAGVAGNNTGSNRWVQIPAKEGN